MEMYIDLKGPLGNAFYLMGAAEKLMKELEWYPEIVERVLEDMKGGDYRHLIEVLEDELGGYVEFTNKPWEEE